MKFPQAWRRPFDSLEKSLAAMIPYAALREEGLRRWKRLGWVGGAGLLLLLVAVVVDVAVSLANYRARAELTAERLQLERQAAAGGGAQDTPRTEAEKFYARFPLQSELPRSLTKLSAMASANSMGIVRADYRAVEQPGTQLVRMTITLPVQGSYGAVYAWLAEMLGAMPEVALESLALRRGDPASNLVEGEIRLALFARRP